MLQNDIYNFKDGFNFDKDDPSVHKKLLTYCTDIPTVQYPDGYISSYTHGINLRNNGYLLTVTDDYKRLIDYGDEVVEINDNFYNKMRGGFLTNAEKETLLQHFQST